MAELSNFFGRSTPRADPAVATPPAAPVTPVTCRSPKPGEWEKALSLLLGKIDQPAGSHQVAQFLQFAEQRQMDLRPLIVAEAENEIVYAVLPLHSPGRTMLLLLPAALPPTRLHHAARLTIDAVCEAGRQAKVQLAQTLLDVGDSETRALSEACGFRFIAELHYLHAEVRRQTVPVILPPGLGWEIYSPSTHERFSRTIASTYRQSLDCPALNGLRDMEDVIDGHKATGQFEPDQWFLLSDASPNVGTPVPLAVLLLNRMLHTNGVELVYLGLVPEARGRGLGELMMRQALSRTIAMGAAQLSLAVDSTNTPALKLYYRHGLQRFGGKLALMRALGPDEHSESDEG